jgi:site-specific recombinase XerD
MGTVRKIGDEYYIEFFTRGLLYQQKAGKDRRAAERLLRDIEGKIQKGEMGIVVRDVEIDIFLKTFLERTRPGHTPRTHARYVSVAGHFKSFCGGVLSEDSKLSCITPGIIEGYRAFLLEGRCIKTGRPVKPKVINFTLYLLRDIFDFAIKLGFLNDNPTRHVRLLKSAQRRGPRVLAQKDARILLERARGDGKVRMELMLRSGLRVEELIELKWTEVDFQNKCFTIRHCLGPENGGHKLRRVAMDIRVFEMMRNFHDQSKSDEGQVFRDALGRPFKKEDLFKELARLVEKAGLDSGVNFRSLRDTFVCHVLRKGISLIDLSKFLGLSDIARVMRYECFLGEVSASVPR